MKTTKSLGAALAAAFVLVGCGTGDVPEAVTTINHVYDENGVLTSDYDGGIPEGAVTFRVRDAATGYTYSVHGSDWADASRKLAERTILLSDSLGALADRLVFPPVDLETITPEDRQRARDLVAAIPDLPSPEALAAMSPDEAEAVLDRAMEAWERVFDMERGR
jgi:hypothetical protein